jgi:hypothetical protein
MALNFICWYGFVHLELRLSDNPVKKHQTRILFLRMEMPSALFKPMEIFIIANSLKPCSLRIFKKER